MITIIKLQELFGQLASKGMEQVLSDWEMLIGFEAKAAPKRTKIAGSAGELVALVGPKHLIVETQVENDVGRMGSIYFAFPNTLVVEVIADLLMIPESARATKAEEGLSDNDIEAFREMANLLCGAWNRVFRDLERDLRISQSVDDLKVWTESESGTPMTTNVGTGRVAYISVSIDCAGAVFPAMILIPFDVTIALAEQLEGDAA